MILSRQNALVKHLKALADKKERLFSGTYLIEGEKVIKEAVSSGREIVAVLGLPELIENYENSPFRVESTTEDIIEYCSDATTPQGIIAEVKMPILSGVLGKNVVLLDGVSDPGNVGTIIRTCAAVGVKDVITVGGADAYSPKCVRSTMSGIFSVNVYSATKEQASGLIKGKLLLVADMAGKPVFGKKADNFCLVIGSESHGVSEYFLSLADEVISLPMKPQMESLNAGVSCSVILYELLQNEL